MNVLKPNKQQDLLVLVRAKYSFREIEKRLGIRRETVSRYAEAAGLWSGADSKAATLVEVATGILAKTGQQIAKWPPDGGASTIAKIPKEARSHCEPYRVFIEQEVAKDRNAVSIFQDLVERFAFTHKYNSVKRFVRALRKREPERFDRLEFLPGEEAQVDYGTGAPAMHPCGKYRTPRLFVMTLKYSGKSFRKVVWKSSTETWAKLHEEAFRSFGGCPQYVVLDNLKEGVLSPDIYEPELNPVYAAMLAHYGVVADPARVRDPNRKGTVENAIGHTQSTALKGRKFDSIEEENEWLRHWEERWASPRIHGRHKRQVMAMFLEEKPSLKVLPLTGFRYFLQETRTVQDDGCIQIDNEFFSAVPVPLFSEVAVRIYADEIEIIDIKSLTTIRRHKKTFIPGHVEMPETERIYNPSRQTRRILEDASKIGPSTRQLCDLFFKDMGRVGHRKMRGVVGLVRRYDAAIIEKASSIAIDKHIRSSGALKEIVSRFQHAKNEAKLKEALTQTHALIRPPQDYGAFWKEHAALNPSETSDNEQEETNAIVYH